MGHPVDASGLEHPHVARIARALAARPARAAERDEPYKESAVALLLHPVEAGLETLLIKRAVREGDPWSGQMALPGGRRDGGESLAETAVRETREEVGLDLGRHGLLLGELDELRPRIPTLPPMIVRPFVFAVTAAPALSFSDEVADAFWVPLADLYDAGRVRDIEIAVRGAHLRRKAIAVGEHHVWGMTEAILRTFEDIWR